MSAADLSAGVAVRIAPHVIRVLAPNPGIMTGAGTNTYVVGDAQGAVIVDPGPDDASHLAAVAAAAPGPVVAILVTHTHPDHWPGAGRLSELTGAPVSAFEARDGLDVDTTLRDGDTLPAGSATLTAIHTPGHARDHLCFLIEPGRLLLTGDQVMHGSTVVLFPPEGDLRAYLSSLARLRALGAQALLPGHGHVFDDPEGAIDAIVAHRRAREAKVVAALAAAGGPVTIDALVPAVYDDVEPRRLPIARGSLWAHLRALVDAGAAGSDGYDSLDDGRWWPLSPGA